MRATAQKVVRRHLLQQPVPARKAAATDTLSALSSGQQLAELGPDVVQHARLGLGRGVDAVGLEPLGRIGRITDAGFDAFIGKPINLKEFLDTVRRLLELSPK